MASKVLTITLGNEYIKICEVSYSAQKSVHVHAAVTIPTPDACVEDGVIGDMMLLAKTIKEATDANHLNSKTVIYSIQSTKIASKEIVAPELKEAKLKAFIDTNATDYFPVNIDDYVLSYLVLEPVIEEDVKKQRIMVVAAPLAIVESYYQLSDLLGYNIQSIDYVGNSTLQLMRLQIESAPTIIIQMSEESTIVSILNHNVLQLMRTVPYGKVTVGTALSEKRDIPYDDAVELLTTQSLLAGSFAEGDYVTDSLKYLVNNIGRVMDYYTTKNPGAPIEKAFIITEGAAIAGIEKLLSYELNIKVEKIEMLCNVMAAPELNMTLSSMSLYLANIGAIIMPVNFLPKSQVDKAKSANSSKYFRTALLLCVLVALVVVAIPFTNYVSTKSDRDDYQSKVDSIKDVQETVDAYYDAKDRYIDVASFAVLTNNADDSMLDFIEFLEKEMPSDISISSLSVTSGSVTMSCTGSSKESLAAFIAALKGVNNISNVYCASFSESKDAAGVVTVSYSIVCNFTSFGEDETLLENPGTQQTETSAASDETEEETEDAEQ